MLTRQRARWLAAEEKKEETLVSREENSNDSSDDEVLPSSIENADSDLTSDDDDDDDNFVGGNSNNKKFDDNNNNELLEAISGPNESSSYLGKDRTTVWSKTEPPTSKTLLKNILTEVAGVKEPAKNAKSPLEAWEIFFDSSVIKQITLFTNQKLEIFRKSFTRPRDCPLADDDEIRAFIGLLYLSGSLKLSHTDTNKIWATDGSAPIYFRSIMSENRFCTLQRALRFGDANTRKERATYDKLAPIRELVSDMSRKFLDMYSIGECVTIDEMMFGFKGKCGFRQYLPMKPQSHRLKAFSLVDSDTFYTSVIEIYTGKQQPGPFFIDNKPATIVKRISASILGTGRNITMDNWFSSIGVIDKLQKEDHTTVVATIKKNLKELPPEFVNLKKRPVNSSLIGYNEGKVLVSYVPKKDKCVVVVSSLHQSGTIDVNTGDQQKPEIITFYNRTKGDVDTVDQLRGSYTVARCSNRWPLTLFYGILDLVGFNSQIIYSKNTNHTIPRKKYLKCLATELTKPWMIRRLKISNLSADLRSSIMNCAGIKRTKTNNYNHLASDRKRCAFCPSKKNRKTSTVCCHCSSRICGEHTRAICEQCFNLDNTVEN